MRNSVVQTAQVHEVIGLSRLIEDQPTARASQAVM